MSHRIKRIRLNTGNARSRGQTRIQEFKREIWNSSGGRVEGANLEGEFIGLGKLARKSGQSSCKNG